MKHEAPRGVRAAVLQAAIADLASPESAALADELLRRGIDRGELPEGTDPELLIEALIAVPAPAGADRPIDPGRRPTDRRPGLGRRRPGSPMAETGTVSLSRPRITPADDGGQAAGQLEQAPRPLRDGQAAASTPRAVSTAQTIGAPGPGRRHTGRPREFRPWGS
jgi:hypothetical protein